MFYGRYIDDTLVIIKPEDLNHVHNALNSFDCNLKFTLDTFHDIVPHVHVIWINLPYLGTQGNQLLLSIRYKIT